MTEDSGQLFVFSTVGDAASARRLADGVVGAGLAACVNILPPVTSVFRWEPEAGDAAAAAVQAEQEVMLIIKTSASAYPALESHLRAEHPYELPEIVAVPLTRGLPAFLQWIDASTRC
ncbi:MAG: divalent-cation tolerance protein CutA [Halofilum sp. (in: g-proteobacteria)]|nr:divalent-cation tolerance protein CutA [Halofilum sp. (in: g-proteobacteria)]